MKLSLEPLLGLGLAGLDNASLQAQGEKIREFLASFSARHQGFVDLPRSKAILLAVKHLAERFKGKHRNIVILGIGGSALGITCLREALLGPYWNFHGSPRLFVLDNLDLVEELEKAVDLEETLFVVISKSGQTPETLAQYFYFRKTVSKEQFVFITDPVSGELRRIGQEEGIPLLEIPENVGGRFSVLSPVGLFPAALLGLPVEELLQGAEEMSRAFFSEDFHKNLPFQLAAAQYLLEYEHAVGSTVLMPYSSSLVGLADWYGQLLAESIGKNGKGLTPIRALGVTDQHSQLQLYAEGPTNKLFLMLEVENEGKRLEIPAIQGEALGYLSGKSFHDLTRAEYEGTVQSLLEYKKPVIRISIPSITARELGQLIFCFEGSIAFLGECYSIDAFNQPGVELSKKLTKTLLSQK